MQAPQTTTVSKSNVEQVSVLGIGVQVIGEPCFPLPPLPPADDRRWSPFPWVRALICRLLNNNWGGLAVAFLLFP